MRSFLILISIIFAIHSFGFAQKKKGKSKKALSVILDTDMGPDYDDVGALAVLHHLADKGEANILATLSCNRMENSVPLIHILNSYYGRPNIPIGTVKQDGLNVDAWHKGEKWTDALIKKYPTLHPKSPEADDAVRVYRKVLAAQPDTSIVIITIGFFTNLNNLLNSPADDLSPLKGADLVKLKVKNLVSMAGRFPKGREYNVYAEVSSSKSVIDNWPTEILFSGAEIGRYIRTGDKLITSRIDNGPVKYAYSIAIPQDREEFENSRYEMGGRASYDQTAVLVGVRGIASYFGSERGILTVHQDGSNSWQADSGGRHARLTHKHSFQHLSNIIEEMMVATPKRKLK